VRVGFVEIVLSNLILMMVSHKQKLSIPYQDSEPAVATTPGIPDISIRHTPPLRGTYVYPLLPCGYDSAAIFSTIS
jgi:hypothetical protein